MENNKYSITSNSRIVEIIALYMHVDNSLCNGDRCIFIVLYGNLCFIFVCGCDCSISILNY